MADITQLLEVKRFAWATIANPNPRLAAPISSTDTTITVTAAPTDEDGTAITGGFRMGIRNRDTGYIEYVWVGAGEISGTTITLSNVSQRGCARAGINGIDWITGVAGNRSAHPQDSEVFCVASSLDFEQLFDCQRGAIASGANLWKVGDATDSDIYYYAWNADANRPYFKYDATTSQWVLSNDGTNELDMATGGINTASTGIQIVAADIQIDTSDTTVFVKTSSGAADENKAAILDASGKFAVGFISNTLQNLISDIGSTTGAELAQLAGISANVTDTNLNTLTAGASSDASALHKHPISIKTGTFTYDVSTATGTVNISGVGFAPDLIMISSKLAISGANPYCSFSDGSYDGTNNKCSYFQVNGGASGGASSIKNNIIYLASSSGNYAYATVSATDSDGFTLSWTKVGSSVGSAGLVYTAYKFA